MPYHLMPYTNLHELNIDWIISRIKEINDTRTETAGYAQEAKLYRDTAQLHANNALASANSATMAMNTAQDAATLAGERAGQAAASATQAQQYAEHIGDPVSGLVTQWLQNHVDPATGYVIDDTLTIAGAAADAKATGDRCSELQAELNLLTDSLDSNDILSEDYLDISDFTNGAYINTNVTEGSTVDITPVTAGSYKYQIVPVSIGEKYHVQSRGSNDPRAWAFTDSAYKMIIKCNAQFTQIDDYLTAPSNGYLIVNSYVASGIIIAIAKQTYSSNLRSLLDEKTDKGYYDLTYIVRNNNNGYIPSAAIGSTATVNPVYNFNFKYGVFDVAEGDVFIINGKGGDSARLWMFLDNENTVVSRASSGAVAIDLQITAPVSGKLCYASYENYQNGVYSIKAKANSSTDIYRASVSESENYQRNICIDVLSAFSNLTCCGDSLTASAVYTSPNSARPARKRYPDILGYRIGATTEILATSGYDAMSWWSEYSDRITAKTNQLMIIYLGTNGGLTDTIETDAHGNDYTQYANTNTGCYCKAVAKAVSVNARVLLIKIHKGAGGNVYITNDVIDKVAEKFNVAVVDVPFLSEYKYRAYPDNTGSDSTHYNDLGYAAFVDCLINNVGALSDEMIVRLIPQ